MEDKYKTSPYGCCHPINTSYKTNLKASKDWIVRIEWSDNELSYYNINYLKRWRYDDSSLQLRKYCTEIAAKQAITSDSQLFTIDYASVDEASISQLANALSIPSSYIESYYKAYFIFQQLLDDATDPS